jgi:DME family drug/metabolite transporter
MGASGTTDVLAAACLWGTTGTTRTYLPAASNASIAAVRIVFGGVLLLALTVATGRSDGLRRLVGSWSARLLLAVTSVAMVIYQTAFFSGAARTGVAVGTVVTIGSAPAFSGLLRLALRQAPVTRRWLVATGGAVAGCAALVGSGQGAGVELVGVGLALLSGFAYALYATTMSVLLARGHDERAVAGATFGGATLLVTPVLLSGAAGWTLTGRGALIAIYLGGIATAGAYMLFTRGLQTTPATTATTLTLAEPAIAAVLGVVVLGEQLNGGAVAGLLLLAASLTLLVLPARRSPAPEDTMGEVEGERVDGAEQTVGLSHGSGGHGISGR